jgi:transcriptional regulator with XRE-family HTH domain
MADMEQTQLATAAGVAVGTVYKLEKQRDRFSGAKVETIRRLQEALEATGVRFTDGGGVEPGPKLRRA